MTNSVDQRNSEFAKPKPQVLFVTDPLCSWCFGTLPEVLKARQRFGSTVQFDLIMGGLQIGPPEGLVGYDIKRLHRIWQEVAVTTGQRFSYEIPEGFVYHSEMSCRAVEIARQQSAGRAPFGFFSSLQEAFYHHGRDINDTATLADLLELTEIETQRKLQEPEIIATTRAGFERVRALSANALPHFMIDTGSGYQLLCGGYVTEEFLTPDIELRIKQASH